MATKICEACDKEIGESETKCPACGVDFEELADTVTTVERAQAILEKRRKKNEPQPCAKCKKVHEGACAPAPRKSKLRGLGSILRGKK
jgi:uncharacterized C2H2 Zn-finger protein